MTLQLFRIILFLNGLFVCMMLVPRLLPNDDTAIKTLLLPNEDCSAPCFMNVRAGKTDSTEAARLVAKHVWAQPSLFPMRSLNDMYERFVLWTWSGQQPASINIHRPGQMRIYKNQAVGMIVDTTLPLGAVWLTLGATDKGTVSLAPIRSDINMMLVLVYPEQGLLVRVVVPKHFSQTVLWSSVVEIESTNTEAIAYFGQYHLPSLIRLQANG